MSESETESEVAEVPERRTEILSLRLSATEKRRLTEVADRHRQLAEASDRTPMSLSDWSREQLLRNLDAPLVFPGQNIIVNVQPATDTEDVIRSLRLALAAAERMATRAY